MPSWFIVWYGTGTDQLFITFVKLVTSFHMLAEFTAVDKLTFSFDVGKEQLGAREL